VGSAWADYFDVGSMIYYRIESHFLLALTQPEAQHVLMIYYRIERISAVLGRLVGVAMG